VSPSSEQVDITNIKVGLLLTMHRKIYRTVAGGAVYFLVGTIADSTTTTFTDNVADGSLGAEIVDHAIKVLARTKEFDAGNVTIDKRFKQINFKVDNDRGTVLIDIFVDLVLVETIPQSSNQGLDLTASVGWTTDFWGDPEPVVQRGNDMVWGALDIVLATLRLDQFDRGKFISLQFRHEEVSKRFTLFDFQITHQPKRFKYLRGLN